MHSQYISKYGVVVLMMFCLLVSPSNPEPIPFFSKYDRMDLAIQQEVELTKDPATGEVPKEKLVIAKNYVKQLQANKNAISGINWVERGPNNVAGRSRVIHFDLSDPTGNVVWAASVGGGLWLTTNFQAATPTWTVVDDFFDNIAVTCFVQNPNNHNEMYFGTGEGWYNSDAIRGLGIWQTLDGGNTWTPLPSTLTSDFHYVQDFEISNNVLYAATRNRGVMRSTNQGASWTQVVGSSVGLGSTNRAADLEVASNGDIYATLGMFSTGSVFKSSAATYGVNTGASGNWSDITPSGSFWRIELSVAPSNPNRVYIFCQGNGDYDVTDVFSSNNGGNTWTTRPVPTFCDQGTVDIYTRSQAWYDLISIVDPTDPNVVYTGGVDAVRSDDGGATWTQITSWTGGWGGGGCNTFNDEVHADHHDMAFSPTGSNDLVISTDGGLYYSTNGDAANPSFTPKNIGFNITQFYAGDLHPDADVNEYLAGAQDNGSHRFLGAGLVPTTEVTGGDGAFCHIDQDNPNIQITSYVYNNYRVTLNGWNTVSYRNFNNDGSFINPTDYDDTQNVLYGGNDPNTYFRWNNPASAGSSNTVVNVTGMGGADITHVRVSPNVSNRVYFGLDNGDVVYIDNAHTGNTKTATSIRNGVGSVSCVEIDPNDENHILVTYSNYNVTSVYETTNGGGAWTSVEGNLPDMPIRWALFAPNNSNAALLATEVGVWSTDNLNGSSTVWGPSNGGLANVRVDMIKHRSSDDQILAATHGRGLYTTDYFASLILNFAEASSQHPEDDLDGFLPNPKECLPYTDYPVIVELSKEPGVTVDVDFTVNASSTAILNEDFEIVENSPLVFGINEKSKVITVRVYDDAVLESNETVVLDINSSTAPVQDGTILQHTLSIQDNDIDPNLTGSVTILAEDFAGGIPAGWTITDSTGGGAWVYDLDGPVLTGTDALNSTTGANGFMLFDSDGFGNDGVPELSEIILPVLDCSAYSNVTLSFEQFFRKYVGESTTVEVSNDGTNFTTFAVGNNASLATNARSGNPEIINLDLSAIADGEPTVYIRFRWTGSWDYYWEIDDILITGEASTQVETVLTEFDDQYLGPNQTVHFYGSDGEIMATIANGSYDYGCTRVEIVRGAMGTSDFWNTDTSHQVINKVVRVTSDNNSPNPLETYTISLYYDSLEMDDWTSSTGQNISACQLVKVTGVTYDQITPADATYYSNVLVKNATDVNFNVKHYALSAEFSGFSDFLAGVPGLGAGILPVELLFFEGYTANDANYLEWRTATEINNAGFWLQKSYDGQSFENLAWIEGHGNSRVIQDYSFEDKEAKEESYYRLEQVDYDGTTALSKIVALGQNNGSQQRQVYPNPMQDFLHIYSPGPFDYQIFSVEGQLIVQDHMADGLSNIFVGDWPKGVYLLLIDDGFNRKSFQLLKQ